MATTRKKRRATSKKPRTVPEQAETRETQPSREKPRYRPLSRALIERVLLGADGAGQRFTQDGPVLPEVWVAYAAAPLRRIALLFTPYDEVPAGQLARDL